MFAASPSPAGPKDALARLGWQDFEYHLSEYYRDQGYRVEHAVPVPSLKAMGSGIDLRLRRGSESLIVQCRHWDAAEVDDRDVSELLSAMLHEASAGAILVTRGRFSLQAQALAHRQPRLQLVDGDLLRVMLKLPDHLDASPSGAHVPVSRKVAARARHRATYPGASRLLPVLLGGAILLLLALFVWRMSTMHGAVADAPAAAPPAPAQPVPALTVQPKPTVTLAPHEDASRELARRARLHDASPAPAATTHATRQQAEDAMKIMERNTREIGSPH